VVNRFADLALRRPWALLGANLAVLAAALVTASGAPDRLGIGSLTLDDGSAQGRRSEPDLVIAAIGQVPVRSGAYQVALQAISLQVRSDPGVASVRLGPVPASGRSTSLLVSFIPGDGVDRQRAVERLEDEIDPGPLRVAFGGTVATGLDARRQLSGDLWRLELLAIPLVVLVLIGALGLRLVAAPALCAATAIAGTLAGLRVVGDVADLSLLGIAPAAVLGLVLGVEAPTMLVARFRDEAWMATPGEALRRTLEAGAGMVLPFVLAATAATAGLLLIPLDQAPSIVFSCALASVLALASSLVAVPAVLALELRAGHPGAEPSGSSRVTEAPRALARFTAHSGGRTMLALLLALAAMVAAAAPILHAQSRPLSAVDLPAGSQARTAAKVLSASRAEDGAAGLQGTSGDPTPSRARGESLFPKLILAAAVSAAALMLVLAVGFGSLRLIPIAIVTLLPAAAACGLCVLLYQDGHLAGLIDQHRQGALETAAVSSLLAALAAVSAVRGVAAVQAVREERLLGLEPDLAAETASALTAPAAAAATVIAAAMAGVLAGSDLYPAREFGLAIAAGLLIDLALLRVPLVAAVARWGVSPSHATTGVESLRERSTV
jgi:RND superfamily putative drug exporter